MSAREHLLQLAQRDGHLTPHSVLEDARDPNSPLHSHFEWNDGVAAERYRLSQARGLIARYRVTIETGPEETVRVRQFTSIPIGDDQRGYVPTDEALSDHRDVVLQEAIRAVAALRKKYAHLVDFDAVLRQSLTTEEAAAS